MTLQVDLLLGAEVDFLAIYSRRGDIFYHAFNRCLDQISQQPQSGPIYASPFRRLLIPRTAFGIFFTVERQRIFVVAIIDLRLSASRIAERLQL